MSAPAPIRDLSKQTMLQQAAVRRQSRRLQVDASKQSFLRMVSHELRTPLNSIIGFSEILGQELCGPLGSRQYKDYADLINQSGHRLLTLVNQILEIVRLEGQAVDMDLRPEHLEPLIERVVETLESEAASQDVRLVIEPGAMPEVCADARAVQTILTNLLQNAIQFSPPGGEVRIRARPGGDWVSLEIQDQGPGVPGEDIERITRPFEQAGHALTRTTQGAGLGLPIVRLLCEAMDGRLELRSSPAHGLIAAAILPAA